MTIDELEKMPNYSNTHSEVPKKAGNAVVYEFPLGANNIELLKYWKNLDIRCAYKTTYDYFHGWGQSVYNLTKKHIEALPSLTYIYTKTARKKDMNMVVIKEKSDLADYFTQKSLSEGNYRYMHSKFVYPIGPGYWTNVEAVIHKSHVVDVGYIRRRIGPERIEKEINYNTYKNLKECEETLKRHEGLPVMLIGDFIKSRFFDGREISFNQKYEILFLMRDAGLGEYCFGDFIIVPKKFPLNMNLPFCRNGGFRRIMDLRKSMGMEFDFERI